MTCANPACRVLLTRRAVGRRRRWCSEACRLVLRVKRAAKPKDDLDAFMLTQQRRLLGKLEGSARRIQRARSGSGIAAAWDETRDLVLVQHRRG